jgi:serine/threonine protein kinase
MTGGSPLDKDNIKAISFFRKKRNVLLYKASFNDSPVILKCMSSPEHSARQAFCDEYKVMSRLSHPGIPTYHWIRESFCLPDFKDPVLALCMEDCSPDHEADISSLSLGQLLKILYKVSSLLSWLLEEGVLYTDLNPTNLILDEMEDSITVHLVDYTCCYFFLENPYPEYSLRFSYDLSPDLKGQQLLIQELSFLLQDLLNDREDILIPSSVYRLMEEGKRPSISLSLAEYRTMIHTAWLETAEDSEEYEEFEEFEEFEFKEN